MRSMGCSIQSHFNRTCEVCGKEFAQAVYKKVRFKDNICPDCDYWRQLASEGFKDSMFCVRGALYKTVDNGISIMPDKYSYLYVMAKRSAIRVGSLTRIGTVPDRWRNVFFDNAVFIDHHTYSVIHARQQRGECDRIGCYDRYHCLWYTVEIHEADGPWNIIPKKHKTGGECCPAFFDRENLKPFLQPNP